MKEYGANDLLKNQMSMQQDLLDQYQNGGNMGSEEENDSRNQPRFGNYSTIQKAPGPLDEELGNAEQGPDDHRNSSMLTTHRVKSSFDQFPILNKMNSNEVNRNITSGDLSNSNEALKKPSGASGAQKAKGKHHQIILEKEKFMKENQDYRKFLRESVELYKNASITRVDSTNLKIPQII